MTSLLHLDSGANRSSESISRQLTSLFADTWRSTHGSADYRYRDLAANPVPPLSTAYCTLGRRVERHGLVPLHSVAALAEDTAEQREWALTHPLITELLAADVLLIGAPMYNFAIPAALKAWIDRVSFPCDSLMIGTRVVVIAARGGAYGPGTPREAWDFQIPYLRAYFGKQGVAEEDMIFVNAEMTVADFVPHLADFQPLAASSLATAQAEVITQATRPC